MTVIAAAIIGGTSFTGGRGTVIGAVVGSILMGMLNNGLLLLGLSGAHQMIAQGIIIVIAITLSRRESQSSLTGYSTIGSVTANLQPLISRFATVIVPWYFVTMP